TAIDHLPRHIATSHAPHCLFSKAPARLFMTPPDANLNKQKRRHRGVFIALGAVVAFVILFLVIAQAFDVTWGSDDGEEGPTPQEIREGTVDLPTDAPVKEVEPGDPEVRV